MIPLLLSMLLAAEPAKPPAPATTFYPHVLRDSRALHLHLWSNAKAELVVASDGAVTCRVDDVMIGEDDPRFGHCAAQRLRELVKTMYHSPP